MLGTYALVMLTGGAFALLTMMMTPVVMVLGVRSLRRIARELQRANDYREHYEHGTRPGPLGT